jgi:hypothetical protein
MSVFLKGHFIPCSAKFSTHYMQGKKKKEFRNKFLNSFRTQKTSVDTWRPEMNI